MIVQMLLALTLVSTAFAIATPTADACQPVSWWCALNQHWYSTCGSTPLGGTPPIVQCALDTARELAV